MSFLLVDQDNTALPFRFLRRYARAMAYQLSSAPTKQKNKIIYQFNNPKDKSYCVMPKFYLPNMFLCVDWNEDDSSIP